MVLTWASVATKVVAIHRGFDRADQAVTGGIGMDRIRAAFLVLAASTLVSGCGSGVGVVDTQRVMNESVRALEYQRQLNDRERQMTAELSTRQGQVGQAELDRRRASNFTELTQMSKDFQGKLLSQLHEVAAQVAHRDGLRLIVVKRMTVVGGRDVTQQVIDLLR